MAEQLLERPHTIGSRATDADDGLGRLGLALSDPIRRSILISLLDARRCPSDLADEIGTTRPNLSNHLACLRGCGLVRAERTGRHLHYQLVSERLADVIRSIVALAAELPPCDAHLGPGTTIESTT